MPELELKNDFSRDLSQKIFLITGGCRSGKSGYALGLGEQLPGEKRIFIATCIASDMEMKQRVERHRQERSNKWITREIPLKLGRAIDENSREDTVILVDCLTLWISNLLLESPQPERFDRALQELVQAIENSKSRLLLVANEVGAGVVPENRLARQFRDWAGITNQKVAACADRVIWMVSGIPVRIK